MKVVAEKTGAAEVQLSIEVSPEEMEGSLDKALRRLSQRVRIPGFRPGKAPRELVERHVGKQKVLDEALEELVPGAYEKAIEQEKLEPMAMPHIEMVSLEPVVFKATVALRPEVRLGDYRVIAVPLKTAPVTEEAVNQALEGLRRQNATYVPVERPIAFGDIAVLDVDGRLDGQSFWSGEGIQYGVAQGFQVPGPGFPKHLEGLSANAEREFQVEYPEGFSIEELRGKTADFRVKVLEVKEERLPDLDDAFARSLSPDYQDLAQLRDDVSRQLEIRNEAVASIQQEYDALEALAGGATLEYAEVLVQQEAERLRQRELAAAQGGEVPLSRLVELQGKSEDEQREELLAVAKKRVERALVMEALSDAEGIQVTSEEVNAEVARFVAEAGERTVEVRRTLNTLEGRLSVARDIRTHKTLDWLRATAQANAKAGESQQPSPEPEPAQSEAVEEQQQQQQ